MLDEATDCLDCLFQEIKVASLHVLLLFPTPDKSASELLHSVFLATKFLLLLTVVVAMSPTFVFLACLSLFSSYCSSQNVGFVGPYAQGSWPPVTLTNGGTLSCSWTDPGWNPISLSLMNKCALTTVNNYDTQWLLRMYLSPSQSLKCQLLERNTNTGFPR